MAHFNYYAKCTISEVVDCRFMDAATLGEMPQILACIYR